MALQILLISLIICTYSKANVQAEFSPLFGNITISTEPRIHGGRCTKRPASFMAVMVERDKDGTLNARCTGTYLGGRWVLTAAHCLPVPVGITIYLGTFDIRKPVFKAGITYTWSSRDYQGNDPTNIGDIGLVKLDRTPPKNYHNIRSVCLAGGMRNVIRKRVTAMGWGRTYCNSSTSYRLKKTEGVGISCKDKSVSARKKVCGLFHKDGIPDQGDSGGPLLIRSSTGKVLQVGVLSANTIDISTQCPVTDEDVWYTRICGYIKWIKSMYPGVCTDTQVYKKGGPKKPLLSLSHRPVKKSPKKPQKYHDTESESEPLYF